MESVLIVMELEDEFGISIEDRDAERLCAVGAVVKYVSEKLGIECVPQPCPTARSFYSVRRLLVDRFGVPRADVRPKTLVSPLVDESRHAELRGEFDKMNSNPPPAKRSVIIGGTARGYLTAPALFFLITAIVVPDAVFVALASIFVALLVGAIWCDHLGRRDRNRPISRKLRIRDVVNRIALPQMVRSEHHAYQLAAVSLKVRHIMAEQLGLDLDEVKESSHLSKDLGV